MRIQIQIRDARLCELEQIAEIALQAYAPYVAVIGREPAPMRADFTHHFHHDQILIAQDEGSGDVIGYAVLIEKQGQSWLENIAMLPSYSRKGVGRALIAHLESMLAVYRTEYHLYTNSAMTGNIRWYQQLGFEEVGRATQDGFSRVFFRKSLKKRC